MDPSQSLHFVDIIYTMKEIYDEDYILRRTDLPT